MKTKLQRCSSAFLTPVSDGSQWIQLFPAGNISAFDGRKFTLKNPEEVIAASQREMVDLVIDREHGRELLPDGTAVPAAGWIKEMEVRNGGEIWARVEWTPAAQEELKAREFRYMSPVFFAKENGEITKILGGSLVNSPAFEMKAVASSQNGTSSQNPQQEKTMDQNLLAIAALLGMDENAQPADIVGAVSSMKSTLTAVGQALGLAATAKADAILASAQKAKTPDPAQYVPIAAVTELQAQVASLMKDGKEAKATAAVEKATKDGKLSPALKEWGLSLATSDMAAFESFIAKAPVIVAAGETTTTAGKVETAAAKADASALQIAASLGVSKEAFEKTKAKYPTFDAE